MKRIKISYHSYVMRNQPKDQYTFAFPKNEISVLKQKNDVNKVFGKLRF